jgi:hypothetical protein
MTAAFDLHALPSFRDLQGRWSAAVHDNFAARRDLIRSQAIRYVQLAGEEAPGGTGHTVANQIKYETFENGDTAGFRIKLGKVARWQNDGTGIYGPTGERIYPRTAKVLHFFIGGREFFVASVAGVKPNRYLNRAYGRWLPGARADLRKVAQRFKRTFHGSGGATVTP